MAEYGLFSIGNASSAADAADNANSINNDSSAQGQVAAGDARETALSPSGFVYQTPPKTSRSRYTVADSPVQHFVAPRFRSSSGSGQNEEVNESQGGPVDTGGSPISTTSSSDMRHKLFNMLTPTSQLSTPSWHVAVDGPYTPGTRTGANLVLTPRTPEAKKSRNATLCQELLNRPTPHMGKTWKATAKKRGLATVPLRRTGPKPKQLNFKFQAATKAKARANLGPV